MKSCRRGGRSLPPDRPFTRSAEQVEGFDLIENVSASKALSCDLGTGLSKSEAKRRIREDSGEGTSEGLEIVGGDEEPGHLVLDNLGHPASTGGDDGSPRRHGLDQHEGEGLVGRGGDNDIEGREEGGEGGEIAEEADWGARPSHPFDAGVQVSRIGVVIRSGRTDEEKFGLPGKSLPEDLCNGIEKEVLALEWRQLAEQTDREWAGNSKNVPRLVTRGATFKNNRIEPVGNDGEAGSKIRKGVDQTCGDT